MRVHGWQFPPALAPCPAVLASLAAHTDSDAWMCCVSVPVLPMTVKRCAMTRRGLNCRMKAL